MPLSRRALLISAAIAPQNLLRGSERPLRLGGPVFLQSNDPAQLAREHRHLGYSAAYCPAARAADTARIEAIREAFSRENVIIAEVGAASDMAKFLWNTLPSFMIRVTGSFGRIGDQFEFCLSLAPRTDRTVRRTVARRNQLSVACRKRDKLRQSGRRGQR